MVNELRERAAHEKWFAAEFPNTYRDKQRDETTATVIFAHSEVAWVEATDVAKRKDCFERQVETRMRSTKGGWFMVGFDQMVAVCQDKVSAGVLEQRFNEKTNRLEWRAVAEGKDDE